MRTSFVRLSFAATAFAAAASSAPCCWAFGGANNGAFVAAPHRTASLIKGKTHGGVAAFSPAAFPLTSQRLNDRHILKLNMAETSLDTLAPSVDAAKNEEHDMDVAEILDSAEYQEIRRTDPFGYLLAEIQLMDVNALINTAIMISVVLLVLSKLATVDAGMMRGWTVEEMALRIPADNWAGYSAILDREPVSTKAITSATVYTIGDVIAQRTEGASVGELDRPRIMRSMLAGLIGHGPLSHVWYDWSEGLFDDVLHWTEWWSFFPKVVLDQTTWGPFWNNCYIILLGAMKLESPTKIWDDIKRTTIPLVVSGLKLWPLAHCVTYGLIPVENRLLWVDLVEIVWVTILATQASGGTGGGHGVPEDAVEEDGAMAAEAANSAR